MGVDGPIQVDYSSEVSSLMSQKDVDLGTLLMIIGFERTENIEDQIKIQANEMEKRNRILEGLTKILAKCRSVGEKDGVNVNNVKVTDPETGKEITGKEFLEKYGPWPIPGDKYHDGVWSHETKNGAIQLIKGKMETLNSESQLDMIRLQSLMSKRDNIYQAISNLMKTDQRSKDNAVSNLR